MRIAYINGRYVAQTEPQVMLEDRGFQFADGVYEYIAFYNRKLLDAEPHLKRLERSMRELSIPLPMSLASMKLVMRELIERNGREDGGFYLQVTRGVSRRDHPFPKACKPTLSMTICAAKLPKPTEVEQGVKVISQADQRWARRDIKSISLLANVLSKQEAAAQGAREAWLVEEDGRISEGSASNAYIVKSGELITHHADEHILGGIVRDAVLKLARKAGIPVAERSFSLIEARAADEAFITSTSANVLPVVMLDGKPIGSGKVGPVTKKLVQLYAQHLFKQTGKEL